MKIKEVHVWTLIIVVALIGGFMSLRNRSVTFENGRVEIGRPFYPSELFKTEQDLDAFIDIQKTQVENLGKTMNQKMTPETQRVREAMQDAGLERLSWAKKYKELGYDPELQVVLGSSN